MPAKRNPKNTQSNEIISETPIPNNIVPVISVITPVKRTPVSTRSTPTTKATGGRRKPRKTPVSVQSNDIIDDEIIDDIIPETSTAITVTTGKTRTSRATRVTNTTESSELSKFQLLDLRQHAKVRPDMYVGKINLDENELYVYENEMMVKRQVQYVPGLFKIFDEGLVNMRDHAERMRVTQLQQDRLKQGIAIADKSIGINNVYRQVKQISVEINVEEGRITMTNDGDGIPIAIHPEHGIYVPEMIFFHPMSGSNFDDDGQERTWGSNYF